MALVKVYCVLFFPHFSSLFLFAYSQDVSGIYLEDSLKSLQHLCRKLQFQDLFFKAAFSKESISICNHQLFFCTHLWTEVNFQLQKVHIDVILVFLL